MRLKAAAGAKYTIQSVRLVAFSATKEPCALESMAQQRDYEPLFRSQKGMALQAILRTESCREWQSIQTSFDAETLPPSFRNNKPQPEAHKVGISALCKLTVYYIIKQIILRLC